MTNFYSVIPTNVLFSTKIKPSEKLLYGILVSLANQSGEITLTNQEIADLYLSHGHSCSKRTVSCWVNNLISFELISQKMVNNNERILVLVHNPLLPKETQTHKSKSVDYSNEINEIMDYYQEVYGKRPRLSDKLITTISTHFNNGFTVIDFKKVIAVKKIDPFFIENPQYQLPSTLFRPSNFVKYINEYDSKMEINPGKPVLCNEEF